MAQDIVAIGTDTAIGNGTLITANVAGNTLQQRALADGNGSNIVDLGWQSDNDLAILTAGGAFSLRDVNLNTVAPPNDMGAGGRTLSVYGAGPCPDCVFFGLSTPSTQVRNPSFGGIATVGAEGINGGPGNFGDSNVDSVQQPDGDLIFIYNHAAAGPQRLRRQLNGDLASGAGDEGLGAPGGIKVDTQKLVDRIVLARSDRYVELRKGDGSLSPDLGGFTLSVGAFGADIVDIGVLSDDAVVIAVGNELQVRTSDLQGVLALDAAGYFPGRRSDRLPCHGVAHL